MASEILGPLGRRVMDHLWRRGDSTVAEVVEALNATSTRPLAYTTVMTILARLHERGYVARVREGRHFRYTAAFDESSLPIEAGRRELRELIARHGALTLAGFAADLAGQDSTLMESLRALATTEDPTHS